MRWPGLLRSCLLALASSAVLGGCVAPTLGSLEGLCRDLRHEDPARRAHARQTLTAFSTWKFQPQEKLRSPRLTPCVVGAVTAMREGDAEERADAGFLLGYLVSVLGPRAPETVAPALVDMAQEAWQGIERQETPAVADMHRLSDCLDGLASYVDHAPGARALASQVLAHAGLATMAQANEDAVTSLALPDLAPWDTGEDPALTAWGLREAARRVLRSGQGADAHLQDADAG